jgi:CheY-like chemotaxis protein
MVILIAEDDAALRRFLGRILRGDGHTVIAAGDGEEALMASRAHNGPVDLLLTDCEMPRMGGLELCKHIGSERPETKLLVMSGELKTRERSLLARLPFLQKPFVPSDIRECIDSVFRRGPVSG